MMLLPNNKKTIIAQLFIAIITATLPAFSYAQQQLAAILDDQHRFSQNLGFTPKSSLIQTGKKKKLSFSDQVADSKIITNDKLTNNREVILFPNPANNTIVNIQLSSEDTGRYTLQIVNASGIAMMEQSWNGEVVDISSLMPGMYTVSLQNDNKVFIQKLIVGK